MWRGLRNVEIAPIAIAFFGCYILPTVVAWLVLITVHAIAPSYLQDSAVAAMLIILWTLLLAPLLAGYVVARLSTQLPLLHGLLVSFVGSALYILYVIWVKGFDSGHLGVVSIDVIAAVCAAGLFGAWFYRFRKRNVAEL